MVGFKEYDRVTIENKIDGLRFGKRDWTHTGCSRVAPEFRACFYLFGTIVYQERCFAASSPAP